MQNKNYNKEEQFILINVSKYNKLTGIIYTNCDDYKDNSGGGDDMEKRLSKLEAGIDYIKEKLSSHDDEFKKIDDKFDKIDARFDKIDARFDKFPTKDFMNISISDAVKSIKLWMFSIILFSLSSLIISIIKLFNLHHLFH